MSNGIVSVLFKYDTFLGADTENRQLKWKYARGDVAGIFITLPRHLEGEICTQYACYSRISNDRRLFYTRIEFFESWKTRRVIGNGRVFFIRVLFGVESLFENKKPSDLTRMKVLIIETCFRPIPTLIVRDLCFVSNAVATRKFFIFRVRYFEVQTYIFLRIFIIRVEVHRIGRQC